MQSPPRLLVCRQSGGGDRGDFDALIHPPLSLQANALSDHFRPHLGVFIAQVKGQLQVGQEVVGELRVHVQHLQDLVPLDGVQVAVAQRPHVGARLPRLGEEVDELAEDVVLAWGEQVGGGGERGGEVEEKEEEERWSRRGVC